MFTFWATPAGGLAGLVAGTLAAMVHYLAYHFHWLPYGSDMTANFYGALAAWTVCFLVTAGVSAVTKRKGAEELAGLVHTSSQGTKQPWAFALIIAAALLILNWIFY